MPRSIKPYCHAVAISLVSMSAAASPSPITSTAGDAVLADPPATIFLNQWESSTEIRVWYERTTRLESDTFIGFVNTGPVNNQSTQITGMIPAGTWVSSTMIRIDPADSNPITRTGSVTFDQPIIGVYIGFGVSNDALYGKPGVLYNGNNFRGLEMLPAQSNTDSFEVSEDRLSISFVMNITEATDDIRVITQAPCPADLNVDGFIDSADIAAFIALFLAQSPAADLNNDGFIDSGDISGFVALFLEGCP